MKFNYQARTKTGEIQSGVVEATSREAAMNLLRSHELFVTALREAVSPLYAKKLKIFRRIPKKEIVTFSRQLSIMLKSGVPLVEMLEALVRQTGNPVMKERIYKIIEKVEGGSSLSKTFALFPGDFSPFYINMVRSGEESGRLSEVFDYLAGYLEKEYNFNRKVLGIMIYPAFLSVVFLGVIALVILFVVPQMMAFLSEAEQEPPKLTQFLINVSVFVKNWWFLLVLPILGLIVFVYFYLRTKEGKSFFAKNSLKLPVVGNFLKNIYLARFSLNLSTLIAGGLPIVRALEVTADVLNNETYKKIVLDTAEGVKSGEPISAVLARYPEQFPPLCLQMIVVGERTGKLEFSLKNTVNFYQEEVDRGLDNFMRLLEPILIVVFGVLVGGLMAAVILPIYEIVGKL